MALNLFAMVIGDGNLHVNIIKGDLTNHQWEHEPKSHKRNIYCGKAWRTISGEHGIGLVQKPIWILHFPTLLSYEIH